MRVFVTGATGFIGSYLVPELLDAGHDVLGLTRAKDGLERLQGAGAEALLGDMRDLDMLRDAASTVDGVIHAAFDHNAADAARQCETDRQVIAALGAALSGPDKPLVVSSGTGLVASHDGAAVVETDEHPKAAVVPRAATEEAAQALVDAGRRVIVMRLAQVHDTRRQGRISWHIEIAKQQQRVAYVAEGDNRVPAVHVSDAVRLYRLALENGHPGARYHAVAEEGIALREIAEAIAVALHLPVDSIDEQEATRYFGPLAHLAALDLPASSTRTRRELAWEPTGPTLLADLKSADWVHA